MDELRRAFGDIPVEAMEQRSMLWPIVNWIVPIRLEPVGAGDDLYATRHQPLPTVPRTGEWLSIIDRRVPVERVQWMNDGRVLVILRTIAVAYEFTDLLGDAGWNVFPRTDPDDWMSAALLSDE
jgi:hypothetical protein